jgi:hypothetical protein
MHGQVGAALFQRHFQLLDEQALAAHLAERPVQDLVALGGHAQQRHGVATLLSNRAFTCSACHSASRLSRVAITMLLKVVTCL